MAGRGAGIRPVLVLSGSIGNGHDRVAQACRLSLCPDGQHARAVDCMAPLGGQKLLTDALGDLV